MKIRVGYGYDVHKLGNGLRLVLGGIDIPHTKGCIAHSDGDVLIHALCDAILGAANLRDIGFHFPDTSADFENIDSKILLRKTMDLVKAEGWDFANADTTICLEKPKVKDFIGKMQETLAEVMDIDADAISVKATTTETLGFVGTQDGIAAHAVVLLTK